MDAVIAIKATYGAPDTRRVFSARHAGWYRFKITAYAVRGGGDPVRLKISYGSFRQGTIPKVADVLHLAESEPKDFEYRLYLQPNEIVKLQMIDGTNWAPRDDLIELPGPFVAIRAMEMAGPLFDQWPPAGHRTLLGTRDADSLSDEDMPAVLAELAPRLFRRSVDESIVQDYLEFYVAARRQDESPLEAFKLTAKAMMASPHFLYHVEPGAKPDPFALANRLSYFLWRSAPDTELLELAESGALLKETNEDVRSIACWQTPNRSGSLRTLWGSGWTSNMSVKCNPTAISTRNMTRNLSDRWSRRLGLLSARSFTRT